MKTRACGKARHLFVLQIHVGNLLSSHGRIGNPVCKEASLPISLQTGNMVVWADEA